MREQLNIIRGLHDELVAALDHGDVDRFTELVLVREEALATLHAAFECADHQARQAIQPDLAALLPLDRDLQGRAAGMRIDLRTRLDAQHGAAPRPEPPVVSGVFDRQA